MIKNVFTEELDVDVEKVDMGINLIQEKVNHILLKLQKNVIRFLIHLLKINII